MFFEIFHRCHDHETSRYWFAGSKKERTCELMSMTDFFYTYGNILMLGLQTVLFISLVYLAHQFMRIFIKPLYIWIEDVKKRQEYSEAKRSDKISLNKTTKVSHSDETISQTADEVIEELTTYFENSTNTTTDMDQVE